MWEGDTGQSNPLIENFTSNLHMSFEWSVDESLNIRIWYFVFCASWVPQDLWKKKIPMICLLASNVFDCEMNCVYMAVCVLMRSNKFVSNFSIKKLIPKIFVTRTIFIESFVSLWQDLNLFGINFQLSAFAKIFYSSKKYFNRWYTDCTSYIIWICYCFWTGETIILWWIVYTAE